LTNIVYHMDIISVIKVKRDVKKKMERRNEGEERNLVIKVGIEK